MVETKSPQDLFTYLNNTLQPGTSVIKSGIGHGAVLKANGAFSIHTTLANLSTIIIEIPPGSSKVNNDLLKAVAKWNFPDFVKSVIR